MSKFDIEKFPESKTGKRMVSRVSPVYQNSYVAKWLYQVMGLEMDEAKEIVESLREQAFTETVTWAIECQEHKYSIVPDESLTLEERRARLKRRTSQKFPMNPGVLEKYIKNNWDIVVDIDETVDYGYIYLNYLNDIPPTVNDMIKDLRRIKPSHLTLAHQIEREIRFDGDDTIRYGFANLVDGQVRLGIENPPDAVLQYLTEAFTGSSGRRTVGAGPSELTARLKQFFASVNMRAGAGSIPYNPDDIPEWIRRITLPTRISQKLGFGYGLAGRRNVLLALPESALVIPAPIILSGLAGLRQYGLAPPEDAHAGILLGKALARTGRGLAEADPDDIAALIPSIYEDAKITAFYSSSAFAKGKRLLSLALPDEAEIIWRTATAQRNTGGVTVGADPNDLPDTIKGLKKSILTPFIGSALDSKGHRYISVTRPEEARLAIPMGIAVTGAGKHMVPPAMPLPFDLSLVMADLNTRAGHLIVGADMSDMPDGQGDILQDAVITPYLALALAQKGINRIGISQRIEDAKASLSVGFSNGESGLREIGINPEDIPYDQKDILIDALLTPYMTVKALKNGMTTVHGTRPEDSDIPLRTGIAGAGGGRKTIGVNPDDLPDYDKDFLKSSTVAPIYGAKAVSAGKKWISPALPPCGGQTIFTGIATGVGGTSRISTELPKASRCYVLIGHVDGCTGRGEIYPSRADMEKYLDGILDPARVSYNLSFASVGKGQRRISAEKPEDAECRIFVGGTQAITGHITIGADRGDLPPKKRIGAHVGIMQAGLSAVG